MLRSFWGIFDVKMENKQLLQGRDYIKLTDVLKIIQNSQAKVHKRTQQDTKISVIEAKIMDQ